MFTENMAEETLGNTCIGKQLMRNKGVISCEQGSNAKTINEFPHIKHQQFIPAREMESLCNSM